MLRSLIKKRNLPSFGLHRPTVARALALIVAGCLLAPSEGAPGLFFAVAQDLSTEPTPIAPAARTSPSTLRPPPSSAAGRPAFLPESTRRMIQRIDAITARIDPMRHPFISDRRALTWERQLKLPVDPARKVGWQRDYAIELLRAGRSEDAVAAFQEYGRMAQAHRPAEWASGRALLDLSIATAWLRLGEQENCLANHTSQSCLLPIETQGIHILPRGSLNAIPLLTKLLEQNPDELAARWLLNLAHMTLGKYPEAVPQKWLIPPSALGLSTGFPRFSDIARNVGLDVESLAGGVVIEDFNRDGLLDVFVSGMGLNETLRLFWNMGDGTFEEGSAAAGVAELQGGLNMVSTDYNNDGHVDVLVLRGGWSGREGRLPNSLLMNNGDGTFTDVTEAAGIDTEHPCQTAVWLDYNSDGWLDLFLGNESQERQLHRSELFRNNRDGTFTEVSASSGINITAYVKGVTSADYNNDGRPDIYLSCMGRPNILLRNDGPLVPGQDQGPWRFTDQAVAAGVTAPHDSFPTWFFDFDQDGLPDLFVGGYRIFDVGDVAADVLGLAHKAETARLYRNRGDGTFEDASQRTGLSRVMHGMGANFGDIDGDGWPDIYIGTGDPEMSTLIPNRMFRNVRGERFEEITVAGGFGHLQKGHGIAFSDLNNDGSQDVYAVMGGAYSGDVYWNALFANPGHGQSWIGIELEGVQENRRGIGAKVRLVVGNSEERGGGTEERVIHRTVNSGGSFGANPLRLEVGLGNATDVLRVEVDWPRTGKTQTFTNLVTGRFWRLKEAQDSGEVLDTRSFPWPQP